MFVSARSASAGLACAILTWGCGGGGGGGSDPVVSPTPATPSETPLALTAQNYRDAAAFATGYAEVGLMFAQLARDWSEALAASRALSVTLPCDGGGSLTLQLNDKDGNRAPSPGDELAATLSQCYVRVLDDVFDGNASVVFSTPASGVTMAGAWRFGSRFETATATTKIQLQGEAAFEIFTDALNYNVRALSTAVPLQIKACAGSACLEDSITKLDARKELRRDTARITSSWKLRIASNVLGGSLEVATPTPLAGWFDELPDSGSVEAIGAGGAVAALQLDPFLGFRYALGSTISEASYPDVATGYLWWAAGITPPGSGTRGYQLKQRGPTSFAVLSRPVDGPTRQLGTLVWQLSRPSVDPAPKAVFRRTGSAASGYGWSDFEIPGEVSLQGARLSVTPRTGLQPGLSYQIIWTQGNLRDASGATVPLASPLLNVTDSVSADASQSGGKLLFGSSGSLVLDGRASRSADGGALASVNWRQISGPALQILNANTLQPTVTLAAGASATGMAELELEVRNGLGEFDRDRISIPVVNDAKPYRLFAIQPASGQMIYRVSSNDPLTDGKDRIFARDGGGQVLQVGQRLPQTSSSLLVGQSVDFAAGQSSVTDGQNVALAFLDSTFSGACTAGSWTLGEIKTSPLPDTTALSLEQLAIDISLSCGPQGPSKLYVRLNSSRLLP